MAFDNYELDYPQEQSFEVSARTRFIRLVYAHLAGAVLAFAGLCYLLVSTLDDQGVVNLITLGTGQPYGLLILFAVYIASGYIAQALARSRSLPALQYLGLALYIGVMAIMFLPTLWVITNKMGPEAQSLIPTAGILTLAVFAGLTMTVFLTGKDYSFLYPIIAVGSWIAFGVIICAMIWGFHLGLFFSFAMVALLAGCLLYQTSNVLHHYPTDQYVAASLELFASVAVLFFYILRILMEMQSNRN
jgi:FtsH-binding integral membrane protein